jgi:hypothetical protein
MMSRVERRTDLMDISENSDLNARETKCQYEKLEISWNFELVEQVGCSIH